MKAIQLILTTEDTSLEQKIEKLEERCKKLNLSFPTVLETAALTMPTKQFIEMLLMYADDKLYEIEQTEKTKNFWNKFRKSK